MDWLSQNWIWVVVGVGVAYFLFRGHLGGHGAGHGGLMGMGHGGHAGSGGGGHEHPPDSRAAVKTPEAAVDPVGGETVRTAQALTSLHQGKIYYFASKENRERFETAPQQFSQNAPGHRMDAAGSAEHRTHRRHGC